MNVRNRVREMRLVKASDLLPNLLNWRTHGPAQTEALEGILTEVGFAGALLAYETPEGLRLIDGHLRAETLPDMEVPVLILDVDAEEAAKLLATFDPIGSMAGKNEEAINELLGVVSTDNQALSDLLATLLPPQGLPPAYSPELNPETAARPVTSGQIDSAQSELESRFTGGQDSLRAVICPYCAEEFSIQPGP